METLQERLQGHVAALARAPRIPGTPEHLQAVEYVRTHLQEAGFRVQREHFQEAGFLGANLYTQPLPPHAAGPRVIVGAHVDSVPESPGADDNASALAALLELAAWIGPRLRDARCPLQLAAYDLEEYGMIGSALHAEMLVRAGTPIRGMLSLEMLAYTDPRPGSQRLPPHLVGRYPDAGTFIGVIGNDDSLPLLRTVAEAMATVPGLPVEHFAVPGHGEVLPETRLSDHSAFWDRGFPALMVTDTSFYRNPHYHQRSDTPETLDYPFLARVTAGICAAVQRLLAE